MYTAKGRMFKMPAIKDPIERLRYEMMMKDEKIEELKKKVKRYKSKYESAQSQLKQLREARDAEYLKKEIETIALANDRLMVEYNNLKRKLKAIEKILKE